MRFHQPVEIGLALQEALEPLSTEEEDDYDQRLFDALWLAHFELALADHLDARFTFTFPRNEETQLLRLRCEVRNKSILLGLVQDLQEATWLSISAGGDRAT